jgi:hypothetical protein
MALAYAALLTACSEPPPPKPEPRSSQEATAMLEAPAARVSWEEAAATFALGGPHTDLQREIMSERLTGQMVEWHIKVYEIKSELGGVELISEPADIQAPAAINLLRVFAFIPAADTEALAVLSAAKTGTKLIVRGRVNQIALRTAVLLAPATVSGSVSVTRSKPTSPKP